MVGHSFCSALLLTSMAFAAVSSQNISCPIPAIFFPTNRTEASCATDADCNTGELCCRWFSSMHCLEGLPTIPKQGVCPARNDIENANCLMDFGGCRFDSECPGDEKCCETPGCSYKECTALAPPPSPPPSQPPSPPPSQPPSSPPSSQTFAPIRCTEIGCGGPPPVPGCKLLVDVRPNGHGCEPVCKVCRDPVLSSPDPVLPSPNLALVCPSYPFYFNIPLLKPVCKSDSDCGAEEKCCQWGEGKQCQKGINTTPKSGACPSRSPTDELLSANCKMDFGGCRHDWECSGNHKCCDTPGCSYKECSAPATSSTPKACTRRGCGGPSAGPNCRLVDEYRPNGPGCGPVCRVCRDPPTTPVFNPATDLACPDYPFYFDVPLDEPVCASDSDCATGEKCCFWGQGRQCKKGVNTLPRPGICPANGGVSSDHECIMDYAGCAYDSECSGKQKCCRDRICGYKSCMSPPSPPQLEEAPFVDITAAGPDTTTAVAPDTTTAILTTTEAANSELGCPDYPFYFNLPLSGPVCTSDSDCVSGEKCCFWGEGMQCKTGLNTRSKPGICPANGGVSSDHECIMDYAGCAYDSECRGKQKCCRDRICGYKSCMSPPSPPQLEEEAPFVDIIAAEPDTTAVAPDTTTAAATPDTTANLTTTEAANSELGCPDYPFYFNIPLSGPVCTSDSDCASGEKCCMWGEGMQCKTGLNTRSKPGVCPADGGVSSDRDCLMDHNGCIYDSECGENQKCCKDQICGYNSCMSLPSPAAQPLSTTSAAPKVGNI